MCLNEEMRVRKCSKEGNYGGGVMRLVTNYCGEVFLEHMICGGVLELGPAEGIMTDILYPHYSDYTIVDGADFFVEDLKKRYPSITALTSLFECFNPDRHYKNIILGHVLEHVENPVEILNLCKNWLDDEGVILAAVPNAKSIHRQAAVNMGLLSSLHELNETDKRNGHRRVYDMDLLKKDFLQAGFSIQYTGGYWLKPLSNAQIDKDWTEDMINAFLALGEKYPEIAGEIYIICTK